MRSHFILNRACASADHQSPCGTRENNSTRYTRYLVSSNTVAVGRAHISSDPEILIQLVNMIDVVQHRDGCLYEVRQKGQNDACYVVVPNPKDLVKSHLMFAVREEVEVLKERIAELMEKINQLEVENTYLRAHASQDTLAQLPAAGAKPPPQPQGPQPPVS